MFTSPPVHEAVLDLAFRAIPALGEPLKTLAFHAALNETYPQSDALPALPPMDENGEVIQGIFMGEPPRRAWRISADDQFVLQIQADRLILNWRRGNGATYPSYASLRDRFSDALRLLIEHIASEGLGEVIPVRSEFAYENTISARDVAEAGGIHAVIPGVGAALTENAAVGDLTDLGVAAAFEFANGEARGRTHVNLQTAVERSTGARIFALRIASSTKPPHNGEGDIASALDVCHDQAFKTFMALTDDEYQKSHWGKE